MTAIINQAASDVMDQRESIIRAFERAWRDGPRPNIEDFLDDLDPSVDGLLSELVHLDLEFRLKAGEPLRVEEYLRHYPSLADFVDVMLSPIHADVPPRLRDEASPFLDESEDRFGHLVPGLEAILKAVGSSTLMSVGGTASREARREELDLPCRFGKFTLLEVAGRGGFGTVFRGHDVELDRIVAVKIPRHASVSRDDEERFLREARNVARLRHPHLVTLYEAGQVDGLPYLASEFIAGSTLAERLRTRAPDVRYSAELVAAIAEALEVAHRLGIIHRDIKPSNILLDEADRPHLADFGLAKHQGGEASLTLDGQLLGTPAYMAPEQARGEAVDARTDVYGLGVVLYELLTGEPPFKGSARMVLWELVECEPRTPRALNGSIQRDLEAICLKAMAKSPAHRYATAAALADDLRRYLRGEPVTARLLRPIDRLARWCRRNPRLAAAASLAAASMILATGLSLGLAWVQYHAAERLRVERENTLAQKQAADDLYRIARSTADDFLVQVADVLGHPDGEMDKLRDLGRTVLDTGLARYRELVARRPEDPELRVQLGRLYTKLARMVSEQRGFAAALHSYRQGVAVHRKLVQENPQNREYRMELSRSLLGLGTALVRLASYEDGLIAHRESLALAEALDLIQPDNPETLLQLTSILYEMGGTVASLGWKDESISILKRAVDILERLTQLESGQRVHDCMRIAVYQSLGEVLIGVDRPNEAVDAFRRALEIARKLVRDDPSDTYHLKSSVPIILNMLAHTLYTANRPAEALPLAIDSCARWKELLGDWSQAVPHRAYQGDNLLTLGLVYQALGQFVKALDCFHQAEAIHRGLSRENPGLNWAQCSLALARRYQGGLLRRAGRHDEALPALREARAIVEAMPELTNFDRFNLAACLTQTQFLARSGRPVSETGTVPDQDEARQFADRAMELLREGAKRTKPRPSRYYFFVDPDLAPLRDRADFKELVETLGLAERPPFQLERPSSSSVPNNLESRVPAQKSEVGIERDSDGLARRFYGPDELPSVSTGNDTDVDNEGRGASDPQRPSDGVPSDERRSLPEGAPGDVQAVHRPHTGGSRRGDMSGQMAVNKRS